MGKTVGGAVWLNADQLSDFDYWQFWRNTDDRDVATRLRLFTDLPLDEIARLEALQGAEINEAKKILANEATALCRGEDASRLAAETARRTFEEGTSGDALPRIPVTGDRIGLVAALTTAGLAASGGEAKRKIAEGAVRVDDVAITDPGYEIMLASAETKLSLGKKKHAILVSLIPSS
jgi:tyrosyl-tRNA synthetase